MEAVRKYRDRAGPAVRVVMLLLAIQSLHVLQMFAGEASRFPSSHHPDAKAGAAFRWTCSVS